MILVSDVVNLLVIVVEKLASFPSANANSFNVSKAGPAPFTKLDISVLTYAVVASWSEPKPPLAAVGAVGIPVNAGDANGAYVPWIYVLL